MTENSGRSKLKIIDPHIHLFKLELGIYAWLQAHNPPFWLDKSKIKRNFDFADLVLPNFELDGIVHIEAGFDNQKPWRELAWLDEAHNASLQATLNTPALRTIAGIDICQEHRQFIQHIESCHEFESCVGIRHIFDDNTQVICDSSHAFTNLSMLNNLSSYNKPFVFELQMDFCNQLDVDKAYRLFKQFDNLSLLINHAGFLAVNDIEKRKRWRKNMRLFSALPWVYVKCSGLEMMYRDYTDTELEKTLEALLEIFGIERVMVASNFPLVNFSIPLDAYWGRAAVITRNLTSNYERLLSNNARRIYHFGTSS